MTKRTLADLVLTLAGIVALLVIMQEKFATRVTPQRTPAPSAPATCDAIEVVQGADTIVYEVRRKRGERCRVTLPEGARHGR